MSTRLPHQFHSRVLSHYYSVWRLWAAVFRPWPGSPLLRQPGSRGLPLCYHIDTELSADILSTWRSMMENPHPQTIHLIQFSSSWVTEARHHPQLTGYLLYFVRFFPRKKLQIKKNLHIYHMSKNPVNLVKMQAQSYWAKTNRHISHEYSSPRKSLVKGERFMRYEGKFECFLPFFKHIK